MKDIGGWYGEWEFSDMEDKFHFSSLYMRFPTGVYFLSWLQENLTKAFSFDSLLEGSN